MTADVQKQPLVDPKLKQWATKLQKRYVDAVNEANSFRGGARLLGIKAPDNVRRSIRSLEKRAALKGWSPSHAMTRTVPDTFKVKRISTNYDRDGQVAQQWVISSPEETLAFEALQEFMESLSEGITGLSPLVEPPSGFMDDDLLAVYPMGDPHFGMYAWAEEAGDDFDLDKAEEQLKGAVDTLVAGAPPARTALLLELGDFFHTDNESNRTNHSGHALDVDTRWAKVMQVGFHAMVHCILRLLEKHEKVIVRIVKGNHDGHSSYSLAIALSAWFRNNPRVTIDLSPAAIWAFEFGKVMLASTHGDTCKMVALPPVMATDWPEMWGRTRFRYGLMGHVHHDEVKEYPGVRCETFRTLAARDAWHAGAGYRAGRDMRLIVYHREYGEIARQRCDIAMLRKDKA